MFRNEHINALGEKPLKLFQSKSKVRCERKYNLFYKPEPHPR